MGRGSMATALLIAALAAPAGAAAQSASAHLQGFGGLTFGDVTRASTFGGSLAMPLTSTIQIVGEGGQIRDVMPSLLGTALSFTPVDLRLAAWYGEGGVRLVGAPASALRPYGEATVGAARLRTRVAGLGTTADALANTGLAFLDTTRPMLGVGGGIILQGGAAFVDLGYRYKKVLAGDALQAALTGGDFGVSQVRVGVGIRF